MHRVDVDALAAGPRPAADTKSPRQADEDPFDIVHASPRQAGKLAASAEKLQLIPIRVAAGQARSVRDAVRSIVRDSIRIWKRREWWDNGQVPPQVEGEARLQAFAQATLRPKCGWPHAPHRHETEARSGSGSGMLSPQRRSSPGSRGTGRSDGADSVPDPCECPGFRARRREIGSPAP